MNPNSQTTYIDAMALGPELAAVREILQRMGTGCSENTPDWIKR